MEHSLMIEVKDLEKSYGDHLAVRSISFEVPAGKVVGFLGPNGAGKTTVLKILSTILTPDAGQVRIAGFDLAKDPEQVRETLGYLPEQPPLDLDHTVHEYLTFCMSLRSVPKANRQKNLDRAIAAGKLSEVLNRRIGNLSKGFRQRVGLAQALVHDPALLILDEPTVGLDPAQIREIRQWIKNLEGEKTVLLSSHLLHEVVGSCSSILMLHRGSIVDQIELSEEVDASQLEQRFLEKMSLESDFRQPTTTTAGSE